MAALPSETSENSGTREVTASVVRSAWAAAQEWTAAWKAGSSQLRTVVDGLEDLGTDSVPSNKVHEAAKGVHGALVKMVSGMWWLKETLPIASQKLRHKTACTFHPLDIFHSK